ncbi:MAG: hypothetical protein RDV41_13930 [Planctomycetota bacterium]|nr:hypothetical protein [Planctomycetota bacterium]
MYTLSLAVCVLFCAFLAAGCGEEADNAARSGCVEFVCTWGVRGTADGCFAGGPRGLTVGKNGSIYTIDKAGRVQEFSQEGRFISAWWPPDVSAGRPQDIEADGVGNLYIADTHYDRVLKYSGAGELLAQWGKNGSGPGEFVYPVGIAVDRTGNVYVSEYGAAHRIQKFDPEGRFLLEWGAFGEGDGEFNRPQDLAVGRAGEIFVADSCNHRIQVFSSDGKLLRKLGAAGDAPGQFRYPYGLAVAPDGDVVVLEYGNSRVQVIHADGSVECSGKTGRGDLEFNSPWDVAIGASGDLYVADTQNFRIQRLRLVPR